MNSFNLSDWALRHRSLVWYFMIAFMAAGLFSYLQLGREEDPAFTIKTMVIQAQWPGASARGDHAPGHRQDREEARGAGVARLHQERQRCRPNDDLRLSARHHESQRCGPDLGAGAQHDCGHQAHLPARRPRARLQRSLRRCVRQHLCFHKRRADSAPAARSGRGCSREDLDCAECGKGRHSWRAGRVHLPRIFHPEDRRTRPRYPLDHQLAAGAECRHALRRVPGRDRSASACASTASLRRRQT